MTNNIHYLKLPMWHVYQKRRVYVKRKYVLGGTILGLENDPNNHDIIKGLEEILFHTQSKIDELDSYIIGQYKQTLPPVPNKPAPSLHDILKPHPQCPVPFGPRDPNDSA